MLCASISLYSLVWTLSNTYLRQSGSLRGAAPLLEKIYSLSLHIESGEFKRGTAPLRKPLFPLPREEGWAGIQRGFIPAGIRGTG